MMVWKIATPPASPIVHEKPLSVSSRPHVRHEGNARLMSEANKSPTPWNTSTRGIPPPCSRRDDTSKAQATSYHSSDARSFTSGLALCDSSWREGVIG